MLLEQRSQESIVTYISLDKGIARISFRTLQVLEITSVCQLVEIYDPIIGVPVQNVMNEVTPDKSGPACDQKIHAIFD
jgi:hypothetical protein